VRLTAVKLVAFANSNRFLRRFVMVRGSQSASEAPWRFLESIYRVEQQKHEVT
jgi:hypothetical protein